ncbi:alanine racemase [Listeria ivanovii]|uniref:Alanine racemase n=1 Tax=Listeria ivanovii (strain ATCC BAA-678 / PAM 55) TaxID=881621 RepID=G2ZDP1_LISIP|nr:alanine racemase [Listeria ivanovii]AHI55384.1 alanine racemase [Listeria ivanovii WSLC3009]AIS64844.1 alanine racemase [Listeria ivanovii subsp. ivanovii]MBC1758445.1 alanine racemase [Listeria ivanovii]MBK3913321.1 alanine racemase [Listeria ivanovii subsp. ivanovii]MBK3920562.1 alanine racemase [Listeria ivanovii subsp. ivanovii]
MVTGWHRPTWIEIDCAAIRENIQNEQKRLPKNVAVWAVVKANAYGHGIIEVAKTAKEAGVKGFCVAILDEALALREAGFRDDFILVLGATRKEDANLAARKNISLTIYREDWLEGVNPEVPLKVHLKIDSGMGRLGIRGAQEAAQIEAKIAENKNLILEGVYTHFATADQLETSYFDQQLVRFHTILRALNERPTFVHTANSAASLLQSQVDFDAIRFGISMYGLTPSIEIKASLPFKLKPALALYTEMVHVKELAPGDSVSYGATYTATEKEWVATLPIGYADGLIRHYSGFHVLVNGEKVPIVGRVCMDQTIIKLPHEFQTGSKVTIIGTDQENTVTVDDAAEYLDTINYEVTCMLTERIPRKYIH